MCGIAGKVGTAEGIDEDLIRRMGARLRHRGPDAEGLFVEDGAALTIRRLAIIDVEGGNQPVFNEDGSVLVIQNGEIYNYVELRDELERRGHRFRTRSDTEVIVHLYEEFGANCVEHLRGMFAFAIWDRRRRRLLLGRDRLGKKPLYYASRDGRLSFASELQALLEDPDLPREMDGHAVDAYLQLQYVPNPLCAVRGIAKLPPAHILLWRGGEATTRRYWRLSYAPMEGRLAEEEVCERIREELGEATKLRLRSDVPVGAFLSGGIDSSAVVATMAEASGSRIETFSVGFDDPRFDESRKAAIVARTFDTEHHEFVVRPDGLDAAPLVAWHYGEPFADHSAIPSLKLAELTRHHVKVALNGDGGDESFAGYRRYLMAALAGRAARLPAPVPRAISAAARLASRGARGHADRRRLAQMADGVGSSSGGRFAQWLAFFTRPELDRLYTDEFRASLSPYSVADSIDEIITCSDAQDELNALLDVDVQTYLPGALLVKMDIATMAHGLEVRSPLLDHKFMRFAASLPATLKLKGLDHKHVFKRALRPLLPPEILNAPKMGFTVPLAEWLRGEQRGFPAEILLDHRSLERGIFRPEGISALLDEHVKGRADNANRIWALIQLELWLRTFIDGHRDSPLALNLS